MHKARVAVGIVLALAGATILSVIPYSRWSFARERLDIERAITPLLTIPADDLATTPQLTLEVSLPTDRQWRRLVQRMGRPRLMLLLADGRGDPGRGTSGPINNRISARASIDGQPVTLTVTPDMPWGVQASTRASGYQFVVDQGQTAQLTIGLTKVRPDFSAVLLVPEWNPIEIWDKADSLAMGQGITDQFAPTMLALGCGLLFVAAMLGLLPSRTSR